MFPAGIIFQQFFQVDAKGKKKVKKQLVKFLYRTYQYCLQSYQTCFHED